MKDIKKDTTAPRRDACTYCDLVGVDEETMFKMTEALGLGMGCMDGNLRGLWREPASWPG